MIGSLWEALPRGEQPGKQSDLFRRRESIISHDGSVDDARGSLLTRLRYGRSQGHKAKKYGRSQRKYDLQAATESLFEQRPFDGGCADRTPGQPLQPGSRLVSGTASGFRGWSPNQPLYLRTRLESLTVSRSEVPALTIAADPSERVEVTGDRREDWSLRYCAYVEWSSEDEARDRLQGVPLGLWYKLLVNIKGSASL